jgi:hypothetical protein
VHTVTTRAERARALRLGADGLMTDTPRYLTGATNAYPAPPTVLKVFRAPEPTQLSDAGWMQVRVSAESGPGLPDTPVRVSGDGVAGRVVGRTPQAVVTIKLATRQSHVGSRSVRVAVSPGSAHERRWGAGSRSVPVTLTPEDLQLRPGVATRGRQVRFGLRLLDSAAAGYTGRRRETGPRRTVLGLGRAQLRLTVRHGGRVVHRTTARGTDAGRAGAGDGRVVLAWQAPARGRYVVRVSERGPSYQATGVSRRFRVR